MRKGPSTMQNLNASFDSLVKSVYEFIKEKHKNNQNIQMEWMYCLLGNFGGKYHYHIGTKYYPPFLSARNYSFGNRVNFSQ